MPAFTQGCHPPGPAAPLPAEVRQVALIGGPNTGKSTLYNKLTGGRAHVANWPGLTVDLLRGALPGDALGYHYQLVDLPGIHDLKGSSEDEAIVRSYLAASPPDLIVLVLNTSCAATQLRLALELRAAGLPFIVALNMSDEAARFGVQVNAARLSEELQLPVVAISARNGTGVPELLEQVHRLETISVPPPAALEPGELDARLLALSAACVQATGGVVDQLSHRLDRFLLHPVVGVLAFLVVMLGMFQVIYAIGTPLQELLSGAADRLEIQLLQPMLQALQLPPFLLQLATDGLWLGLTTVVSFMPIIFLFYLMVSLIEDSGYLARSAFLMDGFMHWLGMDGRSFVLQIMGFGCNVPAIMGTRVIRDRPRRLLSMLVIPFSLCQARLAVFVFMAGAFFVRPWWAAGLVVFGFYVMSFVAAALTALLFKHVYRSREGFVLELPPYRTPSAGTMLPRAWQQMVNFFFTTRQFIVIGVVAVWLLNNLPPGVDPLSGLSLSGMIGRTFQPLLGPIGMNPALTVSLIFGFVAKEILLGAMAVIYATSQAGLGGALVQAITPLQAVSFMMFTLLYTPCLSTVAVQWQESGSRMFVIVSLLWSFTLAWVMALITYQGGLLLGLG